MTAAAMTSRRAPGAALLSVGFRPFFLLSAAWAMAAVPLWLLMLVGRADLAMPFLPMIWHGHEMVFGYGLATLAGFLLTAIPSWTGGRALQGAALAALAVLWMLGRVAMLLPALPLALRVALDLALPIALVVIVARELLAGRNWRNVPVLLALTVLLGADLLADVAADADAALAMGGIRLGLATLLTLIALIGGRIIPAFTRNWLMARDPTGPMPVPFGRFDRLVLLVTVISLTIWVWAPDAALVAALLIVAGVLHAVRSARWRAWATTGEPLLFVLHVGYKWFWLGLMLLGAARFIPALPQDAALHALTVGAIGTMTLGVMTRASLGHTGRALTAGPGCSSMFVLVSVAAMLRVTASLVPTCPWLLDVSGAAWSAAFGLFLILFAPILCSPREGACVAP